MILPRSNGQLTGVRGMIAAQVVRLKLGVFPAVIFLMGCGSQQSVQNPAPPKQYKCVAEFQQNNCGSLNQCAEVCQHGEIQEI